MRNRSQYVELGFAAVAVCVVAVVFAAGLCVLEGFGSASGVSLLRPAVADRFTIADLDGDRKPDLATVEIDNERSSRTDYSIRIELSAGRESAFWLKGPAGGLRLAARDVNGDDALDLIVSSLSDAGVVAVLLNDGHGRFAFAESDQYALAKEGGVLLRQRERVAGDRLTLAQPRPTFDDAYFSANAESNPRSTHLLSQHRERSSAWFSSSSVHGRAPPSVESLA